MPAKGDREDTDLEPEQMRKIFIGGLDYGTTEETLEAYFERWGDIVDLVVMKDPYTKRSRGFGFVTYAHSEMVDEAMSHRPHKIDGREVETKRAIPKEEIENIPQQALDVKKLFVGGLKHLEEQDLQEHFAQFGNVVSCDIILNRDSGVKRGFAFVEYDDTDAVDKVILHKKHEVKGVRLFVKKAVEWNEVKKSKDGYRSSRGGFRGSRGGRGGRDDYFERRGGYRDDYDNGRRGGGGSRGGRGSSFGRRGDYGRDDMYESSYRGGGGRRGGFRDDDDWDDRPPRRDFSRRGDDDWEMDRPARRFREDSMERGYGGGGGGGGGRWESDSPKKSWGGGGGGDSWRRSPDRGDSGFGGGRYGGGGGGPVRSSFSSSSRSAPYDTSYPLNRRGRY